MPGLPSGALWLSEPSLSCSNSSQQPSFSSASLALPRLSFLKAKRRPKRKSCSQPPRRFLLRSNSWRLENHAAQRKNPPYPVRGVEFNGGADLRRDCLFGGNQRRGAYSGDSVSHAWNHWIHRSTDSGRYSSLFLYRHHYRHHSFVPEKK